MRSTVTAIAALILGGCDLPEMTAVATTDTEDVLDNVIEETIDSLDHYPIHLIFADTLHESIREGVRQAARIWGRALATTETASYVSHRTGWCGSLHFENETGFPPGLTIVVDALKIEDYYLGALARGSTCLWDKNRKLPVVSQILMLPGTTARGAIDIAVHEMGHAVGVMPFSHWWGPSGLQSAPDTMNNLKRRPIWRYGDAATDSVYNAYGWPGKVYIDTDSPGHWHWCTEMYAVIDKRRNPAYTSHKDLWMGTDRRDAMYARFPLFTDSLWTTEFVPSPVTLQSLKSTTGWNPIVDTYPIRYDSILYRLGPDPVCPQGANR